MSLLIPLTPAALNHVTKFELRDITTRLWNLTVILTTVTAVKVDWTWMWIHDSHVKPAGSEMIQQLMSHQKRLRDELPQEQRKVTPYPIDPLKV